MNPIGWCDRTINPITGCLNGCPYCYARRFAPRLAGRFGYPEDEPFRPTFHMDRVDEIYNLSLKGSGRIFLDSMGDWFSEGVQPAWIDIVLERVARQPGYIFLVLTKRPERIVGWTAVSEKITELPKNIWFGVSVTCQEDVWRLASLRAALPENVPKFVSFEPLHGPIEAMNLSRIKWAIIGSETGNRKGSIPTKGEWVNGLIEMLDERGIPVFMKDNLAKHLFPAFDLRQEFPGAMQ